MGEHSAAKDQKLAVLRQSCAQNVPDSLDTIRVISRSQIWIRLGTAFSDGKVLGLLGASKKCLVGGPPLQLTPVTHNVDILVDFDRTNSSGVPRIFLRCTKPKLK